MSKSGFFFNSTIFIWIFIVGIAYVFIFCECEQIVEHCIAVDGSEAGKYEFNRESYIRSLLFFQPDIRLLQSPAKMQK